MQRVHFDIIQPHKVHQKQNNEPTEKQLTALIMAIVSLRLFLTGADHQQKETMLHTLVVESLA